MTYELAFWCENTPIAADRAAATLGRLRQGEPAGVRAYTGIASFHQELTARFPDPDGALLAPDNVWAGPLTVTERFVLLPVDDAHAAAVGPFARQVADRLGLICFDPQTGEVHLPAMLRPPPAPRADVRLEPSDGFEIDFPDAAEIEETVRRLGVDQWFVIMHHRENQHYLQAATGPEAGLAPGVFSMEYRDGGADRHYRCEPSGLDAVVAAFAEYARDDDGWKRRHTWHKVTF